MSRAFVKESDGLEVDELPERMISPHRNLVTDAGLRHIDDTLAGLEVELHAARAADDRSAVARVERDLRYWRQRRATAEVVPAAAPTERVRFGNQVTLEASDGRLQHYRIVGEDEGDPRHGLISYASPLGERLLGARIGELVALHDGDAEIVAIA